MIFIQEEHSKASGVNGSVFTHNSCCFAVLYLNQ